MCILVNNLEMARIKLTDLDDELSSILGESLKDAFKFLKNSIVKLIGIILYRVCYSLCIILKLIILLL